MSKKLLYAVLGGVCAAGLTCFIVGLIVYLTSIGNAVPVLISLFTMATGAIIAVFTGLVLLVIFIVHLITKQNKDKR